MTSISSLDTIKPTRSPSPASSPTLEDDIAQTRAWVEHDGAASSEVGHGKGEARQQYVDLGEDNAELSDANSYPPTSEQEAETRRVEATLRRWEIAERHRRKAARESTSSNTIATSPSLLSDVTRRASLLWKSGSRRQNPSIGGRHTALQSTDNLDAVPLEDINASPTPTPSPSPSPSSTPSLRQPSTDTDLVADAVKKTIIISKDTTADNPFENPTTPTALEAVSPFADTHRIDVDDNPQTPIRKSKSRAAEKRRSRPPPPMPLGLPRPKTPPPVAISTPPTPTHPPDATRGVQEANEAEKPVRWWHEWLCGCGEGPDRGGDYQAGKTNPFE